MGHAARVEVFEKRITRHRPARNGAVYYRHVQEPLPLGKRTEVLIRVPCVQQDDLVGIKLAIALLPLLQFVSRDSGTSPGARLVEVFSRINHRARPNEGL